MLWLKVRALSRHKQLGLFVSENNLTLTARTIREQNIELFGLLETMPEAMPMVDDYLRVKNHNWYDSMGVDEAALKEDLYKVRQYSWGGDQNNSLDKHLVSKYVKQISSYDVLIGKREEIADNSWNYVQNSWYNNWTSYLIESLFKHHKKVVSAIGEIKSVDFFIEDYPIDLKVTFFPRRFLDDKLKDRLGRRELPWLKHQAREFGITVDEALADSQQLYTLTEKLSETSHTDILAFLKHSQGEVVKEACDNPVELMTWLYSNQGEMRFGAENRLFVIRVDATDMSQSWKMKRSFSLIEPKVVDYLDKFDDSSLKEIDFKYNNHCFKTLSDIIFVVKE